jgi:uncharacterized protein
MAHCLRAAGVPGRGGSGPRGFRGAEAPGLRGTEARRGSGAHASCPAALRSSGHDGAVEFAADRCPFTVDRPVMRQRWERLTFLHWPVDPAQVRRLLPRGLEADLFGGAAWVGLVPFYMRVATAGDRRMPWVSNFCETNVRTYVRDRHGQPGIWFLSLDAARLGAVAVARVAYRLPYFWSAMDLTWQADHVSYRCRRRLPGPRGAASLVRIRIGDRYRPSELGEFDHFLTARWVLFSVSRDGAKHRLARACHEPWPLYRAEVTALHDELITAAGLSRPRGEPVVHYSPGVDVAIGRPER